MIEVDTVQYPNNQNEENANKPLIMESRQNDRSRCKHNDEQIMICAEQNTVVCKLENEILFCFSTNKFMMVPGRLIFSRI